jgi:hypothetical protein
MVSIVDIHPEIIINYLGTSMQDSVFIDNNGIIYKSNGPVFDREIDEQLSFVVVATDRVGNTV